MGYASFSKFRKLTSINRNLISDDVLKEIFPLADRIVNKLVSTPVKKEKLSGNIDSSNVDFKTRHSPICDTTMKNVLVVDACDTADYTESTDGTADTLAGSLSKDGGSSIAMGKDGTTEAFVSYTKTSTSRDGTGRRLRISVYIKDINELSQSDAMEVRIGSAADAYYTKTFARADLRNGINQVDILVTDMGTSGTPLIAALDYILIEFTVPAVTDLITHGDLKMDDWKLVDIDDPDTADITVYYATSDDTTGWTEYGSSQTVTSIQTDEGIITMTTAPTTTTAEAGVFCDYSYVSKYMDWNLINAAACYMAAHLSSFIIAGTAPNFTSIEDGFMRRDLAGAPDEWLRLCYSLLINAVGDGSTGMGFRKVETKDLANNLSVR